MTLSVLSTIASKSGMDFEEKKYAESCEEHNKDEGNHRPAAVYEEGGLRREDGAGVRFQQDHLRDSYGKEEIQKRDAGRKRSRVPGTRVVHRKWEDVSQGMVHELASQAVSDIR